MTAHARLSFVGLSMLALLGSASPAWAAPTPDVAPASGASEPSSASVSEPASGGPGSPAPSSAATNKPAGHAPIAQEYVLQAVNRGFTIEVGQADVRLLDNGVVAKQVERPAGAVTLAGVSRLIDQPDLLTVKDGEATLTASLYLAPGVTFSVGDDIDTLHLVANQFGTAGCIFGDGATVRFNGVDVVGWDAAAKAPASASPYRPYIVFVDGSNVTVTQSTFASLGRNQDGARGFSSYGSATLTVDGTTFSASEQGLTASGDKRAKLSDVTAKDNMLSGIWVGGPSVTASKLTASGNGGDGVTVASATAASIEDVTSTGNKGAGMALVTSNRAALKDLVFSDNAGVGLDLRDSDQVSLGGLKATGGRFGLATDAASSGLKASSLTVTNAADAGVQLGGDAFALDDVTTTGGAGGVRVRSEAADGALTRVTVSGARTNGADLAGTRIKLTDADITGGANGIDVSRPAQTITLRNVKIHDAATGLRVREGVGAVSASKLTINGGQWGADVRSGGTQISDSSISGVTDGVRMPAASGLTNVNVSASDCAIRGEGGAPLVQGGTIHARRGTCGNAPLPGMQFLPPLEPRPLGIFAGSMALLAVVYEVVRRLREGRRSAS